MYERSRLTRAIDFIGELAVFLAVVFVVSAGVGVVGYWIQGSWVWAVLPGSLIGLWAADWVQGKMEN